MEIPRYRGIEKCCRILWKLFIVKVMKSVAKSYENHWLESNRKMSPNLMECISTLLNVRKSVAKSYGNPWVEKNRSNKGHPSNKD